MRFPIHSSGKTMPWQWPALVELGKTNWHAATDGGMAVKLVVRAQEQTFTTLRHPRQHLRTLQGNQYAVATSQAQTVTGKIAEILNH
jgi:hypothetical protein